MLTAVKLETLLSHVTIVKLETLLSHAYYTETGNAA